MIALLSWTLRLAVLALLAMPLVVPTISARSPQSASRTLTLVTDRDHTPGERRQVVQHLRNRFGEESQITLQNLSNETMHPLQVYDAIGQTVRGLRDIVVLDLSAGLWGDNAKRFADKLAATDAFRTGRLYRLEGTQPGSQMDTPPGNQGEFLLLADLYVPKVSFLGEETLAVVEIAGSLPAGSRENIELLVRSNGDLVTTERRSITAPSTGMVQTVVEVPVSFMKAQAQTISIELRSEKTLNDYAHASTTVFVAHNKTTVLHVAVGPDWSLRSMRQKLKFWPNLDLLSYYILRERWDDNSVPQSQLSLIEFPSDKLFGEQLPNFHGIVAQNFFFDHYLAQRDALNLVDYVKQGGRMFLQAGPLSYLSKDPAIQSLFPCKNQPTYKEDEKPQKWEPAQGSTIQLPEDLASSLPSIQSRINFRGCEAKESAFVLAQLESGDPVLFAQNLGKGLVVSSLAADWHTQSVPLAAAGAGAGASDTSAALLSASLQSGAAENLSTWIIEFLQRRQDSGLRAPDLAGPRLTTADRFLLTRSRGAFRQEAEVIVRGPQGQELIARPVSLPFLEREGLLLPKSLGSILPNSTDTRFSQLGLVLRAGGQSDEDTDALVRGGLWPITAPPVLPLPANPSLLGGVPSTDAPHGLSATDDAMVRNSIEERPLIEVYPWLMALALALLCLDTFVTIVLRRQSRHIPQGR
jgi:hypothetical protein